MGSLNDGGVYAPGPHPVVGELRLYLGARGGAALEASWVLDAAPAGEHFCGRISRAGDVNGDGFGDITIGTRWSGPSSGPSRAGSAGIYLGSATGISRTATVILRGGPTIDWFAHSLAAAGDVNGDGFADVIVGAPLARHGAAYLHYGSATAIASTPALVISGGASEHSFGWSVAMEMGPFTLGSQS